MRSPFRSRHETMTTLTLTWLDGEETRSRVVVNSPFHIGRSTSADLSFPHDGALSYMHARIERNGNGWQIVDLGSANGTFVNGRRVEVGQNLSPGDHLQCGNQLIEIGDAEETIVVRCPNCNQELRLPAHYNNVVVGCPGCNQPFVLSPQDVEQATSASLKPLPVPPSKECFHAFAKTEGCLARLAELLKIHESLSDLRALVEDLRQYIAHPLSLLVAGPFNSGKSTLINCLVGMRILPSDITPTTAVPTILTFGGSPRLIATYRNGERVLALSDLADFAAEDSERGASLRTDLLHLLVQVPSKLLRHVAIIDSPGLHSVNDEHAQRTAWIHSHADAVLWVTSCAQSASAAEVEDILKLKGRLRPLVVANQLDLLGDEDETHLALDRMRVRLGLNSMSLVGLSARYALEGIETHDRQLVLRSRWPIFYETFISSFLPARYAERFAVVFAEILRVLDLIGHRLSMETTELQRRESAATHAATEVERAQAQVDTLTTAAGVWERLKKPISDIPVLNSDNEQWLTRPLEQCIQSFSRMEFPPDISSLPIPQSTELQSEADRLQHVLGPLKLRAAEYVTRGQEIEGDQRRQSLAEISLRQRELQFKQKHAVVQFLSFRYRAELEEEGRRLQAERENVDRCVANVRSEAQTYVDEVNRLVRDYVHFIKRGYEIVASALEEERRRLAAAQSRLRSAEKQRDLQSWARLTANRFTTEVRPLIWEAAMTDIASARRLFDGTELYGE